MYGPAESEPRGGKRLMSQLSSQAEDSLPPSLWSVQTLRGRDEAHVSRQATCFPRSTESGVRLPQSHPRRPPRDDVQPNAWAPAAPSG